MRFFWQKRRDEEIERELRAHLDLEAEEQREAGLPEEEARFAARRTLGNQGLVKEDTRAVWIWAVLETLTQDLRYALRSLRKSPVFAAVAILSLALGIGANTAIFSFVNALLLKKLPVPQAERLIQLSEDENGKQINSVFSYPMIEAFDRENTAFDGLFGRFPVRMNLTTDAGAYPINGEVVTGKYFSTLAVRPALGRLLNDDDVQAATGNPICVISYALWQSRFGGDPNILSRKILISAHPYSVIGVAEKGFSGPQLQARVDIQTPVSRAGDFMKGPFVSMWKSTGFSWLEPLARLKPGMSLLEAEARINPLGFALRKELAKPHELKALQGANRSFRLTDGSQGVNADTTYSKPLTILMAVVGLVLLIACANVANLLLARAGARASEFAVRLSLGASRGRLMRQLMVESLVLACGGGLLGLAMAFWMIRTLLLYMNAGRSANDELQIGLDPLMIGFSIVLSLLTAIVFGLAPAWQSAKPETSTDLKKAHGQVAGARLRKFLVVVEIALSMVILFAAGLMTRTLAQLRTIDLGFDPGRVIALRVDPAMNGSSEKQSEQIFDEILSRLRLQPGTVAASLAVLTPLEGGMISNGFEVPGRPAKSSDVQTNFNMVSPGYFKTLSQAILGGRDFSDADVMNAPKVAIVNQLFVKQYMPGENPIGRHIKIGGGDFQIIGLVKNSHYQNLREALCPLLYLPAEQTESSGFTVLVRTTLPAKQAIAEIKQTVRNVDARLPIYSIEAMQDLIDSGITPERMLTFLANLFSALVTLLCCIGIYGLVAYAVSRRTREIGIRFAVGAQRDDVAKLFFQESLVLIGAGLLLGLPLALVSARILKSLLFGVEATDARVLILTTAAFFLAGVLASLMPVRKATRIEPMEALRYE